MRTTLLAGILLIGSALVGWTVWRTAAGTSCAPPTHRVLYYQDSMHPWIKSDQPGKCTVCGMDLTPIYEGEKGFGAGDNLVVLNPNSITVLNVQTEEVRRQSLRRNLRVAGTLEPNEARKTVISAPAAGRIEETAIDYAGVEVHEGQRLLTFYSAELSQLKRRYLLRAQLTPEQHDPTGGLAAQRSDADPYFSDLVSPLNGTVIERDVSRGQYVTEGEKLFTIADASVLWFSFAVYEQQLPWLRLGQKVRVSLPALPGEVFEAVISFIDPMLDRSTRSVKVRADLANPQVETDGTKQRLLKFAMYADGDVQSVVPGVLAVPRSAVLFPGKAAYAYLDKGGGAYERRLIRLGRQGDDLWEVRAGLEEGDRVVTSGNVLLDAQAQFSQEGTGGGNDAEAPAAASVAVAALPDPASAPPPPVPQTAVATGASTTPDDAVPAAGASRRAEAQKPRQPSPVTPQAAAASMRTRVRAQVNSARPDMIREKMEGQSAAVVDRIFELRNAELAEVRQAKAAGEGKAAAPTDPATGTPQAGAPADPATPVEPGTPSLPPPPAASAAAPLTDSQRQALLGFLTAADGLSQALAADSVAQFNQQMAGMAAALPPLQKELGSAGRWQELIRNAVAASTLQPAADLPGARVQFLPFSTAAVALAQQCRSSDPAFASLKVYHCPMAPKPGLWLQAKAPLRNPFYGSQMLTCGEEVKP